MRKIMFVLLLVLYGTGVRAQEQELQQLILDYQKLAQLKNILNNMYKGYELVSKGYNTVKDVTQGNFDLHKTFLDGLMAVSPTVRNYKRIGDIINDQASILKEYKSAYKSFQKDPYFRADELDYIAVVYDNLFTESLKNMDALMMVITGGKLRMSDDERLKAIDRIAADMNDKLAFLRYFNNNGRTLAIQRAREHNDLETVQKIYGVNK